MSELQQAQARIAELEEQLAEMKALVEWFKKQMFATGKSERQEVLQMQLKLKEMEQAHEEAVAPQQIAYEREKPKKRTVPAERFENLPVKETVVIEPEEVKHNPELYVRIGEEKTFEVDIVPPRLFKRQIVRPKYRHRLDRSRPPVVAPAPKRLIEGGYASAGLMTWVILSKYRDHLPLYRQEKMFKRWNGSISRQTMCDWIDKVTFELEVIYWKIREGLLRGGYLQVDETPIRFIDPDHKKGKASRGYFWVMGRPGGCVFIEWNPSRGQAAAEKLLDGFKGILQTDGYAGYNGVHGPDTGVTRVACLAHCRRKFADAIGSEPVAAGFMLKLIGNLYHLDNQWEREGFTDPAQRAHLRQRDFAMTLSLLKKAALLLQQRVRPKSDLGQACGYLLDQWDALIKICDYGQVRLDNNLIENEIRPTAVGKKNWLFIGAPHAGKRSAIIYTLILSAQRCGVDPHAYIKDLIQKVPTMTNQKDYTRLLPQNWKASVVTNQDTHGDHSGTENVTIDV